MKRTIKISVIILALVVLLTAVAVTMAACNENKEQSVPKDDHSNSDTPIQPPNKEEHVHEYTLVAAKSPTCTEDGNVQYYTCTCGKYFDNNKNEILLAATVLPANGHDKVTSSWESDGNSHWHKCNNCNERLDLASHQMSDWIIDGGCNKDGTPASRHKECADCDYKEIEENYVVPHTWKDRLTEDKQKECEKCGYKEKVYEERDGKIYFGEYPQTKVEDDGSGLIATLSQMSGDRPVKGDRGNWISYDYFIDWDTSEYMWYIDLEYIGVKYRGVYFTSYRPYYTPMYSSSDKTYQDDNGYYTNTLYWFKWEPIEWRVLETTSSEVFVMSNLIIDAQHYYINIDNRTMNGQTVYPNNYKESDIRAWLNGTFYNWAFDSQEKLNIKTTLVDNSAATTAADSNQYICENTNDKVFLLSYKDVINEEYGFDPDAKNQDKARLLDITDYALSQGSGTAPEYGYNDNNMWWLRSPDTNYFSPEAVNFDGTVNMLLLPYIVSNGVVPAIKIALL